MPKGKVHKCESLLHADRILREVRKIWPKDWEGTVYAWSNGREQGYYLSLLVLEDDRFGQAACVFSEGRSCDGGLVMVGKSSDFDYQTHQPREAVWEERKYFYDTPDFGVTWTEDMRGKGDKKAARYIVDTLQVFLDESIRENAELRDKKRAKLGLAPVGTPAD